MSTKNSKKFKSLKRDILFHNIDSQKSYNRITSNKKHRVKMHHCSSCGYRINRKFSLNSNMNIKINKQTIKILNKKLRKQKTKKLKKKVF